jgi:tRNA dimethylallyltransferase
MPEPVQHNSRMSTTTGRSVDGIITIVGPTASGKSDLSLALAQAVDGEVINADSMQVYQGMDIGTAKLTEAERAGIRHHLLDLWALQEPANVAQYQQLARAAVDDIWQRGRVPIVVGGSGLYVRAIIDDLRFPGTDADVRAELLAQLDEVGAVALHAELMKRDPAAAAAILPTNGRRIVRALEVIHLTGETFTATLPDPMPVIPSLTIGLDIAREVLDERIALRVARMWEKGFVAEVEYLRTIGLDTAPTARQALGYAQILDALMRGVDPDTTREATIVATRRFARRQMSWFRRDAASTWLPWNQPDLATHIARTWQER